MKMAIALLLIFGIRAEAFELDRQAYWKSDWESMRAQVLISDRADKAEANAAIAQLKVQKELCSLELRSLKIPFSCFGLLKLETGYRLIDPKEAPLAFRHLDEVCVREAERVERMPFVRANLPQQSHCRKVLGEKLEKLRYGSSFRAREEVFDLRHRF